MSSVFDNYEKKKLGAEIVFEKYSKIEYNSHSIHTPIDLCEEILSKIDLKDKVIAVLYNIEFVWTMKHLYNIDVSDVTLWTSEFSSFHQEKANIIGCIYLWGELDMKFDIIVGNPPYQKANNQAKRWVLWHDFVRKFTKEADVLALVVPQSVYGAGEMFDIIKQHCIYLNADVKEHFKVGSTFCYFIYDKNHNGKTTVETKDKIFELDLHDYPFLPPVINDETLSQLSTLMNRKNRNWKRGEMHLSNVQFDKENGKYEIFHTNAQTVKTDVDKPTKNLIRVAVSLSGYPKFKLIQNGYCSHATFYTTFDTIKEAEAFADECNSEAIQSMMKSFKWSGWNSREVIELL